MSASYDETITLLEALYHAPILPSRQVGLRRMWRLLGSLGDPHMSFHAVHVVGTAGKGSTATMIAAVMRASGLSTGLFCSPHLQRYSERISLNGAQIEPDSWVRAFNQTWPHVEAMAGDRGAGYALGRPSLFEVLFAMCCVAFREHGIAWAAIEAGLGGRFDPTNTLAPDVVVVTNVSLEHTQMLGNTVGAIAREKAAVIKPGCEVVTAAVDPDALDVIRTRATLVGAPVSVVGSDITVSRSPGGLHSQELQLRDASSNLIVSLPLAGSFQAINAACAFGAARALARRSLPTSDEAVVRGLSNVRIPGRLQVVSESPLVILDGAHNPAAARELAASLREIFAGRAVHLVFAALADKDIGSMAEALAPIARSCVVTMAPGTTRASDPNVAVNAFRGLGVETTVVPDANGALDCAVGAAARDDVIIVTGSMYLVGLMQSRPAPAAT